MERRPAVGVLCVDVAAEFNEELDDIEMSRADGVVQSRDSLIICGGCISDFGGDFLYQIQFALQGGVKEESERVETYSTISSASCLGRIVYQVKALFHWQCRIEKR